MTKQISHAFLFLIPGCPLPAPEEILKLQVYEKKMLTIYIRTPVT